MLFMIPLSYNLRNLIVRRTTSIAAGLGIGLVVFVFASMQMLLASVDQMVNSTGKPENAIVLSKGSDVELSSTVETERVGLILDKPEVARDGAGKPIGEAELVVVLTMDKTDGSGITNVTVRGVEANALTFRPETRIVAGRPAKPGTDEVIIGKQLVGKFKGLTLGGTFELRKNRPVTVVGVFSTDGSVYESEVWGDIDTFRAAFGRQGIASSVRVKLASPSKYDAFERAIETDKALGLEVVREPEYYEKQSEGMALLIKVMGWIIAVSFSAGAIIGAFNTMSASIANRRREIGTLRALGFGRAGILFSFTFEAIVLAIAGGLLGVVAAQAMQFVPFQVPSGFSVVILEFKPTFGVLSSSVIFATILGVLGGMWPAVKAARVSPIEAMRN